MGIRYRYTLFGLLLFSSPAFAQEANHNPLIPDMLADPSIVKIGDTYYCYATTDGYANGLATSGPPVIWTSKDFIHWGFKGTYFPSAANQLYWAPSKPVFVNNKYYLYPTLNTSIYAAVADKPEGPFKLLNGADTLHGPTAPKPMLKIAGPNGTKGIDADILLDDNGQAYMFWAMHGAARLQPDMCTLATAVTVIPTKRKGYSEGPLAFKRKGVYYYLYTLSGHEHYEYAYGYSRQSPLGPYTWPEQDIILTTDKEAKIYGPGHGNVFHEPGTDNYYFIYLEFGNGGTTRQIWADKMAFNEDGTIRPVKLTHKGIGPLGNVKQPRNLAIGAAATASSTMPDHKVIPVTEPTLQRTESYRAQLALDESNGTRWMADSADTAPVFTIDLGKPTAVKRTEAYFVKPTAGHAYRLESSVDGRQWKPCGGHENSIMQSPHADHLSGKIRYLRVTILSGTPGLWEFKVY
jgi:beta-xylosidase